MPTNKQAIALAAIVIAASTSACTHFGPGASDFQECPTAKNGVACMSARQVYQATDDRDQLTQADRPAAAEESSQSISRSTTDAGRYAPYRHAPTLPAVNGPIPVRTPSQVMRIRLNYWQSTDGNLHVPGYIYTEIVERQWQMGLKAPERAPNLHPLQTVENPSSRSPRANRPTDMRERASSLLEP